MIASEVGPSVCIGARKHANSLPKSPKGNLNTDEASWKIVREVDKERFHKRLATLTLQGCIEANTCLHIRVRIQVAKVYELLQHK